MKRLTECTSVDHVKDTSWCPDHNMYTVLESCHVFTHVSASNTGVAVSLQVITQCDHNLLEQNAIEACVINPPQKLSYTTKLLIEHKVC